MTPADRVRALDPDALAAALDEEGVAVTGPILAPAECRELAALYDDQATAFRSVIDMARYNFGVGQYKYFAYPLPAAVRELRDAFYPPLADVANRWASRLGEKTRWPASHAKLLATCRRSGQRRPTPLLLRYREGGYNCLHQDLYGPIHFPLQVVIQLSAPGCDFDGGELVLVEQRPRMQSRPVVLKPAQGVAAIVPVRERPRQGVRGFHRVRMRHGVARLTRGERTTLGLIFHDAA